MRRELQHLRLHAGATANSSSLAAANSANNASPSACSSPQQAAAAWAWFQHSGSSCITPSKAEGLVAAKSSAKPHNAVGSARPSRFKKEVLSSGEIPRQGSVDDHHVVITQPSRASQRRRHSFDQHRDLADRTSEKYYRRFSSSCRTTSSPCFHFDSGTVDDQDVAKNEEGRNTNPCQINVEACSLLDKFEVEAVCKQLHDRLSPSYRLPCLRTKPHEYHESQKAHRDYPQENLKSRRDFKSCSTATHKPLADNGHHHNMNDVVRRLLHLRIKMSPGHSNSAASAPFFCSSITTANSIVDHHHHRRSPKHSKSQTPINYTATRQAALHNWGIKGNVAKVPNYSGELKLNQVSSIADKASAAADEHESRDFTLGKRKSQQLKRDALHPDHELVEEGTPATPSSPHLSDSKFSKALLPLVSHLPHLSALALGHPKHAVKSSRDDGLLALAGSNRQRQLHGDHVVHIHHHHHHHYHHPQQTNEASAQDAHGLLRHYHLEGHTGAHEFQAPKIYRLHKEKLMISGAVDHGEGCPQHHEYFAVADSLQAAGKLKAKKYLWPAAHRATAGTDHVDLQAPGAPLLTI